MDRLTKFAIGGLAGGAIEGYRGIPSGMFGFFRPIYGVGLSLSSDNFCTNFLLCAIVEELGGLLFNEDHSLWDYSNDPTAISHVSLKNCLWFALACTLINKLL